MSYARFCWEGSDVYLFPDPHERIICQMCKLAPLGESLFTKGDPNHFQFGAIPACESCGGKDGGCPECQFRGDTILDNRSAAIAHLEEHRRAGHCVPDSAFARLKQEIEIHGDKGWEDQEKRGKSVVAADS